MTARGRWRSGYTCSKIKPSGNVRCSGLVASWFEVLWCEDSDGQAIGYDAIYQRQYDRMFCTENGNDTASRRHVYY
eukprot:2635236-Rhodomonas_salina.1